MRIYPFLFLAIAFLQTGKIIGQDNISMVSQTNGLSGGAQFGYLSYTNSDVHPFTEGGLGYGLQLQYGFSHHIAAALSYHHFSVSSETANNTSTPYPYNETNLFGKYNFGSTDSPWRPYVSLGINFTQTKESFYYANINLETLEKYSGSSLCLGGGVSYFINTQLSLDLDLMYRSGAFTTIVINGDELDESFSFSSLTSLLGIFYHFQ